jgi:hypothetical protein
MKYRQPTVYPGYDFRLRCPCKPGDRVTCVAPVDAYYSRYAGRPECKFKPGMVGIVANIDSASVRSGPYGEDASVIVDFTGPEFGFRADLMTTTWRAALRYGNVKLIEAATLSPEQAESYAAIAGCHRRVGRGGVRRQTAAILERLGLATISGDLIFAAIRQN